jgi:hypothetical protein
MVLRIPVFFLFLWIKHSTSEILVLWKLYRITPRTFISYSCIFFLFLRLLNPANQTSPEWKENEFMRTPPHPTLTSPCIMVALCFVNRLPRKSGPGLAYMLAQARNFQAGLTGPVYPWQIYSVSIICPRFIYIRLYTCLHVLMYKTNLI